jgi:hypothetical protein
VSDEKKEPANIDINPIMELAQKFLKTNQDNREKYKEHHASLIDDSEALKKFFNDAVRLDTWLLHSEAIPYCMAVETSQWLDVKSSYRHWTDKVEPLIKAGVGVTLKTVNPDAKEKEWRVKPKEFVQWLHSKKIRPRKELEEVLGLNFADKAASNATYSDHPNAEHHAQKRQKILEAALAILANYPDKCMDKGKVSGAAIARTLEEKSPLWFKGGDIPLSERKIRDLINQALKLPDN